MCLPLTIWCNATFPDDVVSTLKRDLHPHRLLLSQKLAATVLDAGQPDPLMAQASVAFGQPDPQQVIELPNIKWVHITSAGYTRYDTDAFKQAMKTRNGFFTNSSDVYSEPCAQHAMAMVMALARQLPQALDDQRGKRAWPGLQLRSQSRLLNHQSMLIYGYGSIARRLVELLKPFNMQITGVRRKARGDETVSIVTAEHADEMLPHIDHVMNILPASAETQHFFNAHRLSRLSPSSLFYNIGRGNTVDQDALQAALINQKIGGAYLDVTSPEPLPPAHPLWQVPNCWITPHAAGGHDDEMSRLAQHFLQNAKRFAVGAPLLDRVF